MKINFEVRSDRTFKEDWTIRFDNRDARLGAFKVTFPNSRPFRYKTYEQAKNAYDSFTEEGISTVIHKGSVLQYKNIKSKQNDKR